MQSAGIILANMKHLDDVMGAENKEEEEEEGSMDINWLEIAEFVRNVGSEYKQLLIKKKFKFAVSLYDLDVRSKQKAMFMSKHKLRILLYHFLSVFNRLNDPNAARTLKESMFKRTNSMEVALNYITNSTGWAASDARCREWTEIHGECHGDKDNVLVFDDDDDDDIGEYKRLYHENEVEVSVWSLIYETKLADILVNYHYARIHLERSLIATDSEQQREWQPTPGHVVQLDLRERALAHFAVHASRTHKSNYTAVRENENKENIKLSFHYRFIRRSGRVSGWRKECLGPNGEFIIRFRVSSFTSPIYVRLGPSPHSFLYEIEMKPKVNLYRQCISYCAITMEENKKKEEFANLNIPYNNHHGIWFTLHCSKTRFFLLADYMSSLQVSRARVGEEHRPRLITTKRIKANNAMNWIGFASLNDKVTISTPDTDALIMSSWMKWLSATGIHKYSEAYKDTDDDSYNEEEFKSDTSTSSLSPVELKKHLKHTHSTFLIDMIDNMALNRLKQSQQARTMSDHEVLVDDDADDNKKEEEVQADIQVMSEEEDPFESLKRIFSAVRPKFRLVPSLSSRCEFAIEMKCSKPLLTSVIRETFETEGEITQMLGDEFIILHQMVYDKLQIDSNLWNFLSEHVDEICGGDEEDEQEMALLHKFLLNAFRPYDGHSEQEKETMILSMSTMNKNKEQRSQTMRGYQWSPSNPSMEMRNINNGETKVVRMYDFESHQTQTFSFSTIMRINVQLLTRLMSLRDGLSANNEMNEMNANNYNLIDHQIRSYNAMISVLKKHAIWPYIEVKRSRAGTLERLTANKIEYVWRGGTTAVLSDAALPMQMSRVQGGYERMLYYEVEFERVGIDKAINVGATLGKHFSYFTSSARPGLRKCSWGLSGDLGLLYDANANKVPYGPSFQDGMIIGCGFLLRTPEQYDADDLDADKYTSNLFFCYDGLQLKCYPDQDANDSLLPSNVLHKLWAVTSTGSEGCKLRFNFGPRFKFETANQMISNYFSLSERRYRAKHRQQNEEQNDDTNLNEDKLDLLTEAEEEILTELVLQFENEDEDELHQNQFNQTDDSSMRLKYEAQQLLEN